MHTCDNYCPSKHHLDRRASKLVGEPGNDGDLLDTSAVADWLGTSEQWVELGRKAVYGPSFLKVGPWVRYRRGTVRAWLRKRAKAAA